MFLTGMRGAHLLTLAAERGCVIAMKELGSILSKRSSVRWLWYLKAHEHLTVYGADGVCLADVHQEVLALQQDPHCLEQRRIMFQIGVTMKKLTNFEAKTVFGAPAEANSLLAVRNAVEFYESMCSQAKRAVQAWCLIAPRLHLCKDVMRAIAKLLWEARVDADYPLC
jgi:hypothetical protein